MQLLICIIGNLVLFSACVQEEHIKEVTFQVDMRSYDSIDQVGLRGQFTSPPWEVNVPMSDDDNDGIYKVTVQDKTAQSSVSFKFVINEDEFELEGLPNRSIQFQFRPENILYTAVFDNPEGKQEYQ